LKWKRTNSPSPVSYKTGEAIEYTFGKKNSKFTIPKTKKVLFTDKITEKAKHSPGVGKYNPHLSIDKTSRPMMKRH
jgi:hypothetical protein